MYKIWLTANIFAVFSILLVRVHALDNSEFYDYEKRSVPNRTNGDEEAISVLREKIFSIRHVWDFRDVPGVSKKCQEDFDVFIGALDSFELWAVKMYDASAKLSSGVLSGNVNNYGDLDECLSINQPMHSITGRHCGVRIQPFVTNATSTPYIAFLHRLAQSFELMRTQLKDPAHIFGQFSSIVHGVCVPSSCNHGDVERAAKFFADKFTADGTGIAFDVRVAEEMCQVDDKNDDKSVHSKGFFIMSLVLFALMIGLGIFASDYYDGESRVVKAFAMRDNWRRLISLESKSDDISTIHGIRFINAILIFLCHKSTQALIPNLNRTWMAYESSKPISILLRICALYTDAFLMLSGLLVSYSITKAIARGERVSHWREIISRYVRVAPLIISTMLITTFINPHIAKTRNMHRYLIIEKPAQLCRDYGWRNILMIQNWFNIEDMCSLHTHHVVSDFQLFLFAPLLITLLWKSTRAGISVIVGLGIVSSLARFYETYYRGLMYFVPFGAHLSKLVETGNIMYTKPTHRFTVYGIGLILGFVLFKFKDFKMPKRYYVLGWILNLVIFHVMIKSAVEMINIDGEYGHVMHASFAALAPIFYCLPVSWIIFSSQMGYTNFINRFLGWKYFVITTKFCYAFYLIQIPIFQLSFTSIRDIRFHDPATVFDLNEIVVICIYTVFLTLFIETPCNNLKEIFFKRSKLVAATTSKMTVTDQNSNLLPEDKNK